MRLDGKVAIVTGAGSGLGRASALLFAEEGARVVVVDRVRESGQETTKMIADRGKQESYFCEADISIGADCKRMVDETVARFGKLDVLFNNAGIARLTRVETMEESVWDEVMNVNLRGVFLCSKYAIPLLKRNGSGGGAIVNMASINGVLGQRQAGAYSASKAGVIALTKVMALELARDKIKVNCICPGDILTDMVRTPQGMSKEEGEKVMETLRRLHPAGRLGRPDDVAKVALFLASDDSSWMTGQALVVDGGYGAGYNNIYDIIELGLMPGHYEWKGRTPYGGEITGTEGEEELE